MGRNQLEAGAMSVSDLHFRIHDHLDEFGEQVRSTPVQIARELGGLGPR
jgi:hypothetical protein